MGRLNEKLRKFAMTASLAAFALVGCNDSAEIGSSSADTKPAGVDAPVTASKPEAVKFDESFGNAATTDVRGAVPPDTTIAGKRTWQLREAVEQLWPSIKLINASGQPIARTLVVDTTEGPIEILLRPEIAPNHVRNLLALAKLGYYDGLLFERTVHQEADFGGEKSRIDLVIAGCPLGTGDEGVGHLGYSMLAEFQANLKHAEGTVGFWHEEDPDSAGTRFYITLGPAPALDGKFTIIGQVGKGLDVVKRIAAGPVKSGDPASPDNEKPVHPVQIKKAVIVPDLMEK